MLGEILCIRAALGIRRCQELRRSSPKIVYNSKGLFQFTNTLTLIIFSKLIYMFGAEQGGVVIDYNPDVVTRIEKRQSLRKKKRKEKKVENVQKVLKFPCYEYLHYLTLAYSIGNFFAVLGYILIKSSFPQIDIIFAFHSILTGIAVMISSSFIKGINMQILERIMGLYAALLFVGIYAGFYYFQNFNHEYLFETYILCAGIGYCVLNIFILIAGLGITKYLQQPVIEEEKPFIDKGKVYDFFTPNDDSKKTFTMIIDES